MFPTTRELLAAASVRGGSAEQQLWSRIEGSVAAVIRDMGGQKLLARHPREDLVNEAEEEVLRGLANFQYRGRGSFDGWIRKVAENKLKGLARGDGAAKRGLRLLVAAAPGDLERGQRPRQGSQTTPSGQAIKEERRCRLREGFALLPEEEREVLQLLVLDDGYSAAEVASKLGLSERTLFRRKAIALARLWKYLKED